MPELKLGVLNPRLAVDYENRHLRLDGLTSMEVERELVSFALNPHKFGIDREEAWVHFEGRREGKPVSATIEIGEGETRESLDPPDLALISEAKFQLGLEGWQIMAMSLYHIHPEGFGPERNIYGFSSGDLDFSSLLIGDGFYRADHRVVTPAGIYIIEPIREEGANVTDYQETFQLGVDIFLAVEEEKRRICFDQSRDSFAQKGNCFAEEIMKELPKSNPPFKVAFVLSPDQ